MPPGREAARPGATSQRQHILDTALSLMAQRGVDGTSMRDLANAAGLNVASLYHYFPSKRDLLVAVLDERGFLDDLAAPRPPALVRRSGDELAGMLNDMLASMLEVEDFIRLMLGEVMRGDDTAHGVGVELFSATQESLERWLTETEPELCERSGAPEVARMLRAMVVGLFFEHVAGVLDDGGDTAAAFEQRAAEAAAVLRARSV
ncbi:MAG: TetR/AcrR family transcriptional regulator [Acidimicrobiales bacterium]